MTAQGMKGPWILGRRVYQVVRGVRKATSWQYWTAGTPRISIFITDAYRFTRYDVALACADTHSELKDSDEWRVLSADGSRILERS